MDLKKLEINLPSLNILYAASNTGKTFYLKQLLYHLLSKGEFDRVYVWSPTSNLSTSGWGNVINGMYLNFEVDLDKIYQILMLNKKVNEAGKDRRIAIILDDILPTDFGHRLWTDIGTKLRHYNASVFLTSQYYYKIPTTLRNNAHNVYIFKQNSLKNMTGLYEEVLLSFFNNKKEAIAYIKDNTKDFQVIYVDMVRNKLTVSRAREKEYRYKIQQ